MKPKLLIALGIFAFVLLICVGLIVFGSFVAKEQANLDKDFAEIMNVCRGQSVPGAAAYTQSSDRNLLIAIEPNTSGDLTTNTYAIPEDRLATKADEVTLVVCLGREREVLIESCPYHDVEDKDEKTDNVIERYAYERDVKLIVAQTGEVLVEEVLRGAEPNECLETESFKESETLITRKGNSISNGDLREWVRKFMAAQ
jgi:hypothetical protein